MLNLDLELSPEEKKEVDDALEFLTRRFQLEIDGFVLATYLFLSDDITASLKSLFISGMLIYRKWLIEQGVDVLELEGRK